MINLINNIKNSQSYLNSKIKPTSDELYSNYFESLEKYIKPYYFDYSNSYFSKNDFSFLFEHFYNQSLKRFDQFRTSINTGTPIGLFSFYTPSALFPFLLFELLPECLAHGNSLIVFISQDQESDWNQYWLPFCQSLPPGLINSLPYEENLWKLTFQHPSIKGILGYESPLPKDFINTNFLNKKYCFYQSGKTSFCVLDGAPLELAAKDLIDSLSFAKGAFNFSPSRVYIHQKIEKEFKSILQSLSKNDSSPPPFEKLNEILNNQGKMSYHTQEWGLIENASNCSEWQFLPFNAPYAFLMDLKYPFELAKWVNPLPHPEGCIIWCEQEKDLPWLSNLEVSWIRQNKPFYSAFPPLYSGIKEGLLSNLSWGWSSKIL